MIPIHNDPFSINQNNKAQTINSILEKLIQNTAREDPQQLSDVLSLKLCDYPDDTLNLAKQLSENLDKLKTAAKVECFRTLVDFIDRSAENKAYVADVLNNRITAKIDRIFGFYQLGTCGLKIPPHLLDPFVIFFTENFPRVKWDENNYATILNLLVPLPLIDDLLRHQLMDKLLHLNPARFWELGSFPWTNVQFTDALAKAANTQELYYILMMKRPLDPININNIGEDSSLKHSINNEYFIKDCGYGDQKLFNLQVKSTIMEAAAGIQNEGWSFEDLLVFFGFRRYQIAVDAESSDAQYYGCISNQLFRTDCIGTYAPLGERLNRLHLDQHSPKYRLDSDGDGIFYFQGMEVSRVLHGDDCITFEHSSPDNLPFLLPYIKRCYENALRQTDPDALIENLGELFWLICFSKPYCKGEVTIAEMFMKTILLIKGCPTFSWKPGIIPWSEAVCQPEKDIFARDFKQMLVFESF